jgi:hypothetical protein
VNQKQTDSNHRNHIPFRVPTPDPATASALLTAESLIVAAIAVIGQRDFLSDYTDTPLGRRYGILGAIMLSLTIAISFLATIAYLHISQYPDGVFGTMFNPQLVFNIAVFSLVGLVYISLTGSVYLYRMMIQSHRRRNQENE